MKKIIMAALVLILGIGAAEAGSGTGRVTYFVSMTLNGQEAFVVRFSTMNGIASCNSASRFVMTAADPKYKTTLAILLGAWLSGNTTAFVYGTGSCTIYSGSEDLMYACAGGDPC